MKLALTENGRTGTIWHDKCMMSCGMNSRRWWQVTFLGSRREKPSTGAGQPDDVISVRGGASGSGPAREWSLLSHSSGQEPWVLGLEQLFRLQREAGDADGPAGELALVER